MLGDFALEVAIQYVTTGEVDLADAAIETAKGAFNPAKTVANVARLGKAINATRAANTARGRASEARKLAEIGAKKNTEKVSTSTGDRIRDGTKQDGTHVEVKDTQRVDNTGELRSLDEAAGKDGQRIEVYTGTNTDVSRNVNSQTLPNTDIIRCTDLGPKCK